jgi:hypothetical protein
MQVDMHADISGTSNTASGAAHESPCWSLSLSFTVFHCLSQFQMSLFCLNLFCLFPEAISRRQFLLCKPARLLRLQASKKSSFGPHSSGQNFRDRQRDLRYLLPCLRCLLIATESSSMFIHILRLLLSFTCSSPAVPRHSGVRAFPGYKFTEGKLVMNLCAS